MSKTIPRQCMHTSAKVALECDICKDSMVAELIRALARAESIIQWMAPYIGKMAVPSNGIADLNEHWLYVELLQRRGILPQPNPRPDAMNGPSPHKRQK